MVMQVAKLDPQYSSPYSSPTLFAETSIFSTSCFLRIIARSRHKMLILFHQRT